MWYIGVAFSGLCSFVLRLVLCFFLLLYLTLNYVEKLCLLKYHFYLVDTFNYSVSEFRLVKVETFLEIQKLIYETSTIKPLCDQNETSCGEVNL